MTVILLLQLGYWNGGKGNHHSRNEPKVQSHDLCCSINLHREKRLAVLSPVRLLIFERDWCSIFLLSLGELDWRLNFELREEGVLMWIGHEP